MKEGGEISENLIKGEEWVEKTNRVKQNMRERKNETLCFVQ